VVKAIEVHRIFVNSSAHALLLHDSFVYSVEIYRTVPGRYNLEDSKTIQSKTFIKNSTEGFIKNGTSFVKKTQLAAAPLKWLTENKYKEDGKAN
jgi:hypothetical protein